MKKSYRSEFQYPSNSYYSFLDIKHLLRNSKSIRPDKALFKKNSEPYSFTFMESIGKKKAKKLFSFFKNGKKIKKSSFLVGEEKTFTYYEYEFFTMLVCGKRGSETRLTAISKACSANCLKCKKRITREERDNLSLFELSETRYEALCKKCANNLFKRKMCCNFFKLRLDKNRFKDPTVFDFIKFIGGNEGS